MFSNNDIVCILRVLLKFCNTLFNYNKYYSDYKPENIVLCSTENTIINNAATIKFIDFANSTEEYEYCSNCTKEFSKDQM